MVNYTAPYRFVPTSLGNECANQLFAAGRKFMDFGQGVSTGLKVKIAVFGISLFSVPLLDLKYDCAVGAASIPLQTQGFRGIAKLTTTFKTLLFGFIQITKSGYDKEATASTSYLPVDGVPGSFNTILDFQELRNYQSGIGNWYFNQDQFLFSIKIPKTPISLKFYAFAKAYQFNSGTFTTQYTSLPVGSALDVAPFDAGSFNAKFVNGVNPNYPSPANTYIAQESVPAQSLYNNASMRFTARNARFLFNEMEGVTPNNETCSQECQQTGFLLLGDDIFCIGSRTYFVNGLPPNASVLWTVTPAGICSLATNANRTATLTKITDGVVSLTAVISFCNSTVTLTKNIVIGTPVPQQINGPDYDLCFGGTQNTSGIFSVPNPSSSLSYFWQIDGIGAGSGQSISVNARRWGIGNFVIRVRTYTALCGYSEWYESSFAVVNCNNFRFMISPNPSTNQVTVSVDEKAGSSKIKAIEIVSRMGVKVYNQSFGSGNTQVTLPVGNLPPDIYTVRVFDGINWYSQNMVVQR
jgi:hypothetical protein